jgi:hypothetical protein
LQQVQRQKIIYQIGSVKHQDNVRKTSKIWENREIQELFFFEKLLNCLQTGEWHESCAQSFPLPNSEKKNRSLLVGPAIGSPTSRCGHGLSWIRVYTF